MDVFDLDSIDSLLKEFDSLAAAVQHSREPMDFDYIAQADQYEGHHGLGLQLSAQQMASMVSIHLSARHNITQNEYERYLSTLSKLKYYFNRTIVGMDMEQLIIEEVNVRPELQRHLRVPQRYQKYLGN